MKTPFQIQQDRISKSLGVSANDALEKARVMPIGTRSTRNGVTHEKFGEGDWRLVSRAGGRRGQKSDSTAKKGGAGEKKSLISKFEKDIKEAIKDKYLDPSDHEDLQYVFDHLKEGGNPKQMRSFVSNMDTIVRDVIPPRLHEIIGSGKIIKKSESNEELVSKHGDQLLEKSEDGRFQVKTLDGIFKFNSDEMEQMYGGEWMEKSEDVIAISPELEKAENYLDAQDNLIEKGKALPIGTIKKRGDNNFIKTANGWKYHSRASKGSSGQGGSQEVKKESSVKELEKQIGMLERQDVKGYSDWHTLNTDKQFASKQFDVQRVQAFKKYKANLKLYVDKKFSAVSESDGGKIKEIQDMMAKERPRPAKESFMNRAEFNKQVEGLKDKNWKVRSTLHGGVNVGYGNIAGTTRDFPTYREALDYMREETDKSDDDQLTKSESQLDALDDILEKGKALPIGTIKKRGPNNFIKTAVGWKYHSRANKGGGAATPGKKVMGNRGGTPEGHTIKKPIRKQKGSANSEMSSMSDEDLEKRTRNVQHWGTNIRDAARAEIARRESKQKSKGKSKSLTSEDIKNAVLSKFGISKEDIVKEGKHTHEASYKPHFSVTDDGRISFGFSTGKTSNWEEGGTYTSTFGNVMKSGGGYTVVVRSMRNKNNYTNDSISDREIIPYQTFSTKEEAIQRMKDYLNLK